MAHSLDSNFHFIPEKTNGYQSARHKVNMTRDCGETQTMSLIIRSCPLKKLDCSLSGLHFSLLMMTCSVAGKLKR